MIRLRAGTRRHSSGPPRRRGGLPTRDTASPGYRASSPPTRGCSVGLVQAPLGPDVLSADAGCFVDVLPAGVRGVVLPADAGVLRGRPVSPLPPACPPRRRGGTPTGRVTITPSAASSAPRWGCSVQQLVVAQARLGRGGVPPVDLRRVEPTPSSPPTRGCSDAAAHAGLVPAVLPADAGVLRSSSPCRPRPSGPRRRRGGAPDSGNFGATFSPSSPPTRGCSAARGAQGDRRTVLPANAGVFRRASRRPSERPGPPRPTRGCSVHPHGFADLPRVLPRRRGDVPDGMRPAYVSASSSPPTRGCSADRVGALPGRCVLPVDAGVFR